MFEKYLTKTGRLSTKQPQEIKNQWYTQKFKQVHGDIYDYSKLQYANTSTKVLIICKKHGGFYQTPKAHLQGQGCPGCFKESKSLSTQDFVSQQHQVHGHTYGYAKVIYHHSHIPVMINCQIHGLFEQQPRAHLRGQGCPQCGNHNQNTIYLLQCRNTGLFKIGITNNLAKRLQTIGGTLVTLDQVQCVNTREQEKYLHTKYKQFRKVNPTVRTGNTEFFQLNDLQVQEIKDYFNNSIATSEI